MAYYSSGYQSPASSAGVSDTASVKALQQKLNASGAKLTVDGIYGAQTDTAYKKYGPGTSSSTSTTSSSSSSDIASQLQQIAAGLQSGQYSNKYADQLAALTAMQSDEQYQQQATNQYTPQYNAQVLNAQQANEQANLAYQQQLAAIENQKGQDTQTMQQTQAQSLSDLRNSLLRRGMARSGYAAQTEANARAAGFKSLADMQKAYATQSSNVLAQQTLANNQFAQTKQSLADTLTANIANTAQALKSADKQNQMSALQQLLSAYDNNSQFNTSSLLSILQALYSGKMSQEQFNATMAYNKSLKGSTSSTSPNGKPKTVPTPTNPAPSWTDFTNNLKDKKAAEQSGAYYSAMAELALANIASGNTGAKKKGK